MEIISVTGKIPTKRVIVSGVNGHTDDEILNLAMTAAGENRSSLFGTRVSRGDTNTAMVTLHTD